MMVSGTDTAKRGERPSPDLLGGDPGGAQSGESVVQSRTHGRRVRLRPTTPNDYDFLWNLEVDGELHQTWRLRGHTPSPDDFILSLWEGVLASFVIVARDNDRPVGVVTLYNADFRDRHCSLAMATSPNSIGRGYGLEGAALAVEYAFATWDFRKIYGESLEFNLNQFRAAEGVLFSIEGRLVGHAYFNGSYWDKLILAVSREEWAAVRTRVLRAILPIDDEQRRHLQPFVVADTLLDFESFADIVAEELGLPRQQLFPESRVEEDLGLDSFARYGLLVMIEELSGAQLPDDLLPELCRLDDYYYYYCTKESQ